jgi:hypothetical protein
MLLAVTPFRGVLLPLLQILDYQPALLGLEVLLLLRQFYVLLACLFHVIFQRAGLNYEYAVSW